MPPCKLRTKKHKKNREILEIKDLSYLLSSPPLGTNPVNFELMNVGTAVKICFPRGNDSAGERFWCVITEVKREIITGRVDNELIHVPWPLGMKLKFHRNCVYELDDLKQKTDEPYSQMENMRLIPVNEQS